MEKTYRHQLSFPTLRAANQARLPLFKNSLGEPAHTQPDGSDWSPAQWLQAMLGELGEWAEVRLDFESGRIGMSEYKDKCRKELADVQIYFDILCQRAFDEVRDPASTGFSSAQCLMTVVSELGSFANERKKFERGDYSFAEYAPKASDRLGAAMQNLNLLEAVYARSEQTEHGNIVSSVSPFGVDIGKAVEDKFNAVSDRVGCNVKIFNDKVVREEK